MLSGANLKRRSSLSQFQQSATQEVLVADGLVAQRFGQTRGGNSVLMERQLTVEFGPSRSKRFAKAVTEAESGPGESSELEPGRYRVRFVLNKDATLYTGLARLLERVRHWRATEVYAGEEQVSPFHAREMAWCAASQLQSFGDCRFRFSYGVFPRCSVCPLFDSERAIRGHARRKPDPAGRARDHLRAEASRPAGGRPGQAGSGIRAGLAGSRLPAGGVGRAGKR